MVSVVQGIGELRSGILKDATAPSAETTDRAPGTPWVAFKEQKTIQGLKGSSFWAVYSNP